MTRITFLVVFTLLPARLTAADPLPIITDVEGQPLAANAARLVTALEFLGAPLDPATAKDLAAAVEAKDIRKVQQILDPRVLLAVSLNPESRVKVARGPAAAKLQQGGYVPVLVKIVNESTV